MNKSNAVKTIFAMTMMACIEANSQVDMRSHMIMNSYLESLKKHKMEMDEESAKMVKSLRLIDTMPMVQAKMFKDGIR